MAKSKSYSKSSSSKSAKTSTVKSKRPTISKEMYKPSVYIDSMQSKMVGKVKLGQRINLTGIVTSVTDNKRRGSKPSTSINIEISKLKK